MGTFFETQCIINLTWNLVKTQPGHHDGVDKMEGEKQTPLNALAPYPWYYSVSWCLSATIHAETKISAALWAHVTNAVVTCKKNYFGLRRRPREIVLPEIISKSFRGLLQLTNIFQHVQCR